MELEIRRQESAVNDNLREHIERRMEFALGQYGDFVLRVSVHLEDVNGPKGGVDKQCRLLAHLRGGHVVKVEDVDVDFASAVSRAADRVSHAVGRQLERRREHRAG